MKKRQPSAGVSILDEPRAQHVRPLKL